jgi:hypothetical protein
MVMGIGPHAHRWLNGCACRPRLAFPGTATRAAMRNRAITLHARSGRIRLGRYEFEDEGWVVLGRWYARCQELGRDCMAMATRAPIRIAGKSWPTMASAVVSERANGETGMMSLPMVVSVAKLK